MKKLHDTCGDSILSLFKQSYQILSVKQNLTNQIVEFILNVVANRYLVFQFDEDKDDNNEGNDEVNETEEEDYIDQDDENNQTEEEDYIDQDQKTFKMELP